MKHSTADADDSQDRTDTAPEAAANAGDLGPPSARSASAKASSGVRVSRPRLDSDAELVDESELLDEADVAIEQLTAEIPPPPRPSAIRPKAPQLLGKDAFPVASPTQVALARIEALPPHEGEAPLDGDEDDREIDPRLERDAAGVPSVSPPEEEITARMPSSPPASAAPAQAPEAAALLAPVHALPPPPGPLPPVPRPPASLRDHVAQGPALHQPAVSDGARTTRRRRTPRDRQIELPSYTPGAVTLRARRPVVTPPPALTPKPAERRGSSWGWAAALVLVGAGGYAAGRLGAFDGGRAPMARTEISTAKLQAADLVETPTSDAPASIAEAAPIAAAPAPEPLASEPASERAPQESPAATADAKAKATPTGATSERRTVAKAEVETIPVAPPPPSNQLDASAATATLARAGAKAMSCTDPRGGEGTVSVTFLPTGNPVNVKMGGSYSGTSVASCVEQIFRTTRVSPFEGSATTVYYTVRMPGDGKPIN